MVYFVIYSRAEVRIVVVEHFVTDGESYGMVRYVESPRVANPDRIFVPIAVGHHRMILLIISVPMSSRVIHRLRKATTRETHRMLYRGCSV